MVLVTRLNGKEFYVNSDLIEYLEATPDTVITLTTGKKLVVSDTIEEIVDRIVAFRRRGLPEIVAREDLAGETSKSEPLDQETTRSG
jgi:flagellar protein FlbD